MHLFRVSIGLTVVSRRPATFIAFEAVRARVHSQRLHAVTLLLSSLPLQVRRGEGLCLGF